MRLMGTPNPLSSFAIPPSPPTAVETTWRELERIGQLYEERREQLKHAVKKDLVDAQAQDVEAVVQATSRGEQVKDPQQNERKIQTKIEQLEAEVRGLRVATDRAGDALADAIEEHAEEWAETLAEAQNEAARVFEAAIAAARRALAMYVPASSAVGWLTGFNAAQQKSNPHPFAGGRLRVRMRDAGVVSMQGSDVDPMAALRIAELATKSREKEVARV